MRRNLATIFSLLLPQLAAAETAQQTGFPYVWAQLTAQDQVLLRAVTDQPCSSVMAASGGTPVTLAPRTPNMIVPQNGVTMCEATITPSLAGRVQIDGQDIVLPTSAPTRVAIIGDTGCRKEPGDDQGCPAAGKTATATWYFDKIAQAAADTKPDLVIHVGDFVYRENCSLGTQGCAGAALVLKKWNLWDEDFFQPARPLLRAAPWVFVRGNHEDCSFRFHHRRNQRVKVDRGWLGWSLFFSRHAPVDTFDDCLALAKTDSSLIRLPAGAAGALNLFVYDTADEARPDTSDFSDIAALTDETWILTHVPLWGKFSSYRSVPAQSVNMVVSGHEHLFALAQADTAFPLQMIQGASGTKLERASNRQGFPFYDANDSEFSFTMVERSPTGPTSITLCTVSSGNAIVARDTWAMTDSSGAVSIKKLGAPDAAACLPPS